MTQNTVAEQSVTSSEEIVEILIYLYLITSMHQSVTSQWVTRCSPHVKKKYQTWKIYREIFSFKGKIPITSSRETNNWRIIKRMIKQRYNSLAEFEEDLLKHQDRTSAAQNSERLPSKQRVRYPGHRGTKQRLYSALRDTNQALRWITVCCSIGTCDYSADEERCVLTIWPLVASPNRPPKVMTGDMQAQ